MRLLVRASFAAALVLAPSHLPLAMAQQEEVQTTFNEVEFDRLVEKVEADAIELARTVEELYQSRCELALLADCVNGNYDHCLSSYPDETCPGGDSLNLPDCGDGVTCSGLLSFSVSSVVLPKEVANGPNRNPTDPQVIETVCFTKALDDFLAQKRAEDQPYYSTLLHVLWLGQWSFSNFSCHTLRLL